MSPFWNKKHDFWGPLWYRFLNDLKSRKVFVFRYFPMVLDYPKTFIFRCFQMYEIYTLYIYFVYIISFIYLYILYFLYVFQDASILEPRGVVPNTRSKFSESCALFRRHTQNRARWRCGSMAPSRLSVSSERFVQACRLNIASNCFEQWISRAKIKTIVYNIWIYIYIYIKVQN